MVTCQFTPIATLYTCFKEKFGIPRQMNLVPAAPGRLVFDPAFSSRYAVRDLTGFSHIWLVFVFHQALDRPWSALVRPPRLGGNKKVGVFATRSPFRPNPIGMSAVKLEAVEQTAQGPVLHLSGVDILDNTPVLDIKPYLPWADAIPGA
ncbi:MAG: tRNA (N6-threonylcarbamoyladenosine(37)-N6)-methyltransferase TrmO, partial [Desulfotignum sp.]